MIFCKLQGSSIVGEGDTVQKAYDVWKRRVQNAGYLVLPAKSCLFYEGRYIVVAEVDVIVTSTQKELQEVKESKCV